MAKKTQLLKELGKSELADLLLNTGILQELNRTFLNPLGLNLILNQDSELKMEKTEDPEGVTLHTVDKFQLKIFNEYRNNKHRARQQKLGFIIQVKDLIRKDKLTQNEDLNLSSPQNLKLNKLLHCIDDAAYKLKHIFMQNSNEKDKDALDIPFSKVFRSMESDFNKGNYMGAISKAILIHYQDDIELEMDKIKKIKHNQDKILKGDE